MGKIYIDRMTKVSRSLLAFGGVVAVSLGSNAFAQDGKIGGFDIPGQISGAKSKSGGKSSAKKSKLQPQIVVSQSAGSDVRTIQDAMAKVAPGGTILVRGGIYEGDIVVTKPVAIVGALGDYGREPIIRTSASTSCMTIAPDTPVARVSVERIVFEFDNSRSAEPCVKVAGGSVVLRDSAIIPVDSDIPIRASYGQLRPDLNERIARPPRDQRADNAGSRQLESYVARHATPVGAENRGWDYLTGGTGIESYAHARAIESGRMLNGPIAGVRVLAGDVKLDNNTIIGARKAVEFVSYNRAVVQGSLTNNVLLGNGAGITAHGRVADLQMTRNTIKFNSGPGIEIDARDAYGEVKILANMIVGNDTGIFLSEKVRTAIVNSNFVAQNYGDAIQLSTGFSGAIAGNTLAANSGCAVDFFSAEQREINRTFIKVVAGENFIPRMQYDQTNEALDNFDDKVLSKRERKRLKKRNIDPATMMPSCGGEL
ncbi:MAG: right-handed parallel beta-helix repeat-containing protein [Pseudomonadota bacterium]